MDEDMVADIEIIDKFQNEIYFEAIGTDGGGGK